MIQGRRSVWHDGLMVDVEAHGREATRHGRHERQPDAPDVLGESAVGRKHLAGARVSKKRKWYYTRGILRVITWKYII